MSGVGSKDETTKDMKKITKEKKKRVR